VIAQPAGGTFDAAQEVALVTSEEATIYYTRDGSAPSTTSSRYDGPISIGGEERLRFVAVDSAGNLSPIGQADFVVTTSFRDDFESGDLSPWTTVGGVEAIQAPVASGGWAARVMSVDGRPAFLRRALGAPRGEIFVQVMVNVVSMGNSPLSLIRVRTPDNELILSIHLTQSGRLMLQTGDGTSIPSAARLAPGSWHELRVQVTVNGDAGAAGLWLNGVAVIPLSQPLDLGDEPVGQIQLGESAADRTFDVAFDDVVVDVVPIQSGFDVLIEPISATPRADR
jgi:hypothetical protein